MRVPMRPADGRSHTSTVTPLSSVFCFTSTWSRWAARGGAGPSRAAAREAGRGRGGGGRASAGPRGAGAGGGGRRPGRGGGEGGADVRVRHGSSGRAGRCGGLKGD